MVVGSAPDDLGRLAVMADMVDHVGLVRIEQHVGMGGDEVGVTRLGEEPHELPQQLGVEMYLRLLDADDSVLVQQKSAAHDDEFVNAGAVMGQRQAGAMDSQVDVVGACRDFHLQILDTEKIPNHVPNSAEQHLVSFFADIRMLHLPELLR